MGALIHKTTIVYPESAPEAVSRHDHESRCQPATQHGEAKVIVWLEAEYERCYTSSVVIAQLAHCVRTGLKVFNPFKELS